MLTYICNIVTSTYLRRYLDADTFIEIDVFCLVTYVEKRENSESS